MPKVAIWRMSDTRKYCFTQEDIDSFAEEDDVEVLEISEAELEEWRKVSREYFRHQEAIKEKLMDIINRRRYAAL